MRHNNYRGLNQWSGDSDKFTMARHDSTLRIFRIMHYLETVKPGLKVSEIHERLKQDGFEVDIRTVHRDIELLQHAHIPLDTEGKGPESRWRLAPFAEIKQNIQFTYQEIFALYVARKSLDHLRGTPIHSALESLFMKFEKVLGSKSEMFQELLGNIEFRPQMTWHQSVAPVILDTVYSALEEGHPLKIVYKAEGGESPGKPTERTVGPECLYFANGSVYLIAIDLKKNEPRTYALARILEAEMLTSSEYSKQGLSPDNLFKFSLGVLAVGEIDQVEVLLKGPIATFFGERRWHETQETLRTNEGTLLKFKIKINDEFARFILGMGPSAQVLKPERLRLDVQRLANEILINYQRKAS